MKLFYACFSILASLAVITSACASPSAQPSAAGCLLSGVRAATAFPLISLVAGPIAPGANFSAIAALFPALTTVSLSTSSRKGGTTDVSCTDILLKPMKPLMSMHMFRPATRPWLG